MNILSLLSLFGAALVKERIRRAKQRAIWLTLASVTGAAALVTFLCALQIVLADALGPVKADLLIGGVLLVLALCFLLAAKLVGGMGRSIDLPSPAVREATRSITGKPASVASRAPLVIGATVVAGLLLGRYILRS